MKIPYRYECRIILKNGFTYYPDFTFLSPFTCQEIYWEHFGMMEDENYSKNALRKINRYYNNGIKEFDNLIITMESKNVPLNIKIAEEKARKILLKEDS
ncbi:hypothetical protein ABGF49_07935 [Helcococcus ovis]|uniref:hypothetical protein n=1 Tax=Helcococcus ovis TaxID=72026 RepID=UPI00106F6F1C|nr:hypothetical protein [Helcococcus ovis]TFF64901.1 hypothetical protein EQF92_04260 [Helcococcus ovis]